MGRPVERGGESVMAQKGRQQKLVANNKKAYHDYFIDETYEAGVALHGTEVKSMRAGKCSIKESFIRIENGEVFVYGMHVSPYEKGNIFNKDPLRTKKLLLHKYEINKLAGRVAEKGYTLVPLQVYFKEGKVKVEIGLARGKKLYDKRADIARKDQRRETERDFKVQNLYILPLFPFPGQLTETAESVILQSSGVVKVSTGVLQLEKLSVATR